MARIGACVVCVELPSAVVYIAVQTNAARNASVIILIYHSKWLYLTLFARVHFCNYPRVYVSRTD